MVLGVHFTTTVPPGAILTPLVIVTCAFKIPGSPLVLSMLSKVGALKPNSGTGGIKAMIMPPGSQKLLRSSQKKTKQQQQQEANHTHTMRTITTKQTLQDILIFAMNMVSLICFHSNLPIRLDPNKHGYTYHLFS